MSQTTSSNGKLRTKSKEARWSGPQGLLLEMTDVHCIIRNYHTVLREDRKGRESPVQLYHYVLPYRTSDVPQGA